MLSQYLHKAITIACEAHQGQSSINGEPYILHPLRLLINAKSNDERIIAVLHDVIEKSNISLGDLKNKGFNQDIISSIDSLSRRRSESYIDYIGRLMQNKTSVKIKLLDLADNIKIHSENNDNGIYDAKINQYKNALKQIRSK
jgi:(p)ppGpp synthase/HD superfamily hydrolase